jgi:hypothetical protein
MGIKEHAERKHREQKRVNKADKEEDTKTK